MAKQKRKPRVNRSVQTDIDSAVSEAINNAEGLRDELQDWHDNLPENLQSGEKADNLQTAIDALESVSQPDVPECIATDTIEYLSAPPRASRANRLAECQSMMSAAADHAREEAEKLDALKYDAKGRLIVTEPTEEEDDEDDEEPTPRAHAKDGRDDDDDDDDESDDDLDAEGRPLTEEKRDELKTELEAFADECENVVSEWDSVEFPGMFG